MASRSIFDCVKELQEKFEKWAALMQGAGLKFRITCTLRDQLEQTALYMQGRVALRAINDYRMRIGLILINEEDNKIVTKMPLIGKHGEGKAFDFVLMYSIGGDKETIHYNLKYDINRNKMQDYEEAGRLGQSVGMRWGGDWDSDGSMKDETFIDACHFEI